MANRPTQPHLWHLPPCDHRVHLGCIQAGNEEETPAQFLSLHDEPGFFAAFNLSQWESTLSSYGIIKWGKHGPVHFTHRPGWNPMQDQLPPPLPFLISNHISVSNAGTDCGSLVPQAGPQPWVPWWHTPAQLTVHGRCGGEMGSSVTASETDSSLFSRIGWAGNEEVDLIFSNDYHTRSGLCQCDKPFPAIFIHHSMGWATQAATQ